ncbi:MAG: adenylate kinase [Treponema sp.]|nr:adenylate kinase [Treponema sp.]
MIYLITGASHTGKTALAQKLLETRNFPYLSIDHLKMGLIRSGNTTLTPEDDDKLTDYLWPIVREFIKTAVENKQNLIVEGCYIPFDWRKDFTVEYLSEINFICLALTGRYIDEHFEDIRTHGSDIEARLDESYLTKDLVKKENLRFTEGFKNAGEQVVLIDRDYEQEIEKLIASSKS